MNTKTFCIFLLAASAAYPQWTGSGFNSAKSDGAVVIAANDARVVGGVFTWNPARDGWDADADNVYHFASFRIDPGVRVRVRADRMRRPGPMVWLVQGAVEIRGILDVSGNDGSGCVENANRAPSIPGPGGFPGGAGAAGSGLGQRGFGPGSSAAMNVGAAGGAAGFLQCPANHTGVGYQPLSNIVLACTGAAYGNAFLTPLVGGSGGAGTTNLAGGAAGGGAVRLSSDLSIVIGGTGASNDSSIAAKGGGPGFCQPVAGQSYWQGGLGSGGAVHLQAPIVQVGASGAQGIFTDGGATNIGNFFVGSASSGRVRIDATALSGTGSIVPPAATGPLVNVPLPINPVLQVASIDGVAVPASPAGSYLVPDVTINKTTPVPVVISSQNVPPGTPISLYVSTDAAGTDILVPATLGGTLESGTVSVNVTIPTGVQRIYLRATW